MTQGNAPGELDTFPKLLARNAREFGAAPAYREKEYGIWQSWSWADAQENVRAFALGLISLGLKPGEHMAVIGTNRPHLYMAMIAAQCAGAIPVPIYQDSVAEE
ncbi:MAG: long-chain fatty acid--CoA ligase, partial [Alphaproteobacteria bacterium]